MDNTIDMINLYFVGKDKYGLLDNIFNRKINLLKGLEEYENRTAINYNEFNILLIGSEPCLIDDKLSSFDKIIDYDLLMNEMFNITEQLYFNNYDFHHIFNAVKKAKSSAIEEIWVGHSYSLYGVSKNMLKEKCINPSLPSQDLYYSIEVTKDIVSVNHNIKKCFIGTSYWSPYFDLSKTKNGEIKRVENVYYPLLKDSHNYEYSNPKIVDDLNKFKEICKDQLIEAIINLEAIFDIFSKLIYDNNKFYFNDKLKREDYSLIGKNKLSDLNYGYKYMIGRERAEAHNKLIKYIETRDENEGLLKMFLKYLKDKDVQVAIINFPTSIYYNEYTDKKFKTDYYNLITSLKKESEFKFIDLNDYSYEDVDFMDIDHMSIVGANKISHILMGVEGLF